MGLTQVGIKYAYGELADNAVIVDLPKGARVRIRSRRQEFARVFVRTKHSTCEHYLVTFHDPLTHREYYKLGPKLNENFRAKYAIVTRGKNLKPKIGVERFIARHRKLCL